MAGYWKTRRKLFGEDRAFLPMSLYGALSNEHELIETGIFGILPNDQQGRGVLFFDRIRAIPPIASRDQVVSTNPIERNSSKLQSTCPIPHLCIV